MIAAISPSRSDFDESVCTLRYASRVKHVKNRLHVNVETKRGLIESFEDEIAKLQRQLLLIDSRETASALKFREGRKSKSSIERDQIYEEELAVAAKEKEEIVEKISLIQKKILVGGENLFEKAQQQMFLLELSGVELDNLNKSRQDLEERIQLRGIEKIDFAERYTDLREESEDLNTKIKIVQEFLDGSKKEYTERNSDYQNEIEILNENNEELEKELRLADVIVRDYIPKMYRKTVETNVFWNDEIDDFHVSGLQYVGNNQRRNRLDANGSHNIKSVNRDTPQVYGTYCRKKESK